MFLADPPPSPYDLRFALFGIPVRVHPLFWLSGLLLGLNLPLPALIAWMIAFFLAILNHEMGHAVTMRSYGYFPWITLYGFGGMAVPGGSTRGPGTWGQIAISFAGPGAGFLISAVIALALVATGHRVEIGWRYYAIPDVQLLDLVGSLHLTLLLNFFLFISVFWGFVNLLPIYPLDGGHIARELFLRYGGREGLRNSLMLSFVVAGLLVVVGVGRFVQFEDRNGLFIALFFGYLAYMSYAALGSYGGGRW